VGATLAPFIADYSISDHGKYIENMRHIWFTLNYILLPLALKEATEDRNNFMRMQIKGNIL
jgi:hypothetical protein